jgi:hypothetical protein
MQQIHVLVTTLLSIPQPSCKRRSCHMAMYEVMAWPGHADSSVRNGPKGHKGPNRVPSIHYHHNCPWISCSALHTKVALYTTVHKLITPMHARSYAPPHTQAGVLQAKYPHAPWFLNMRCSDSHVCNPSPQQSQANRHQQTSSCTRSCAASPQLT